MGAFNWKGRFFGDLARRDLARFVPRTNPGLRVTLVQVYMRRHMRPIHLWEDQISDNLMEKFPDLKRVLGVDHMYPFGMEGDEKGRSARMMETGTDPFA